MHTAAKKANNANTAKQGGHYCGTYRSSDSGAASCPALVPKSMRTLIQYLVNAMIFAVVAAVLCIIWIMRVSRWMEKKDQPGASANGYGKPTRTDRDVSI
jgi:hypothetical protein